MLRRSGRPERTRAHPANGRPPRTGVRTAGPRLPITMGPPPPADRLPESLLRGRQICARSAPADRGKDRPCPHQAEVRSDLGVDRALSTPPSGSSTTKSASPRRSAPQPRDAEGDAHGFQQLSEGGAAHRSRARTRRCRLVDRAHAWPCRRKPDSCSANTRNTCATARRIACSRSACRRNWATCLWYIANVASKFDLPLSDIAAANLAKVKQRWASERAETAHL